MLPISRTEAIERGFASYCTGVPCKHGHIALRSVTTRQCRMCQGVKNIKYRRRHHDRYVKACRAYAAREKPWLKRDKAKRKPEDKRYREKIKNDPTRLEKKRAYNKQHMKFGPKTVKGERQWLRKNLAQLRAVKRLMGPQKLAASLSPDEVSALGLTLQI